MSIRSFKKENLHCVWDDSLLGKKVLCADTLGGLYHLLECEDAPSTTPSRVSNMALAIWSAEVNGLLLDVGLDYVYTIYRFVADDIDCEVPDGYKVMPIGGSVWLEPTDDVICK